jgi:Tol biopolymer transport system component
MKKALFYMMLSILLLVNCRKDKSVISPEINASTLSKIVYVSDSEGDMNIYTMDNDGSSKKRLTQNQDKDYRPQFSPDGKRIAYFSISGGQGGIWIMNLDGSDNKKLFDMPDIYSRFPEFTPDGEKVIHFSNDNQLFNIVNIDGTDHFTINVAIFTSNFLGPFDFSPDGSKIIFSSDWFNPGNYDLCILDLNSTHIEKLNLPIDSAYDLGPRFSPDGNYVVYFSEGKNYNIYSFDLSTNNHEKLTPDSIYYPFDPIFIPDGSKIIFTAEGLSTVNKNTEKPLGNPTLFIMNSDGSNLQQLSESGGAYSAAVVFSDLDDHLYYLRNTDIYSVDLSILYQEKIIELPFFIDSFLQKGFYFYFNSNGVIYRINKNGTDLINLTNPNQHCFDFQLETS